MTNHYLVNSVCIAQEDDMESWLHNANQDLVAQYVLKCFFLMYIYIYLFIYCRTKKTLLTKTVSYITWVTITHTTNNALTYLQYDYLQSILLKIT